MNTGMGNRPATQSSKQPPALADLFVSFVRIGLSAFGGGLAAWTRREIVQQRGWMDDTAFLSGYGLSQLVPGATNVNLAVFIGTQLRGVPGAIACFLGLTLPGLLIVVVAGVLYLSSRGMPAGAWLGAALAGMGAVAIGLSLGTGVRLGQRNLRGAIPILITAVVTVSIGILGFPLVRVLLVMMPVSLAAAWATRSR
jgi:chromate transporter